MMMHDELAALLPPEVCLALDSAAGMDPERRIKFHKVCKDFAVTAVPDNTTSAAFGHQMLLALPEGQHLDAFKRGRALAGRSAPTGPSSRLRETPPHQWPALLQAFGGNHEIASTSVNNLWSAVTFVMTLRVARAAL
jgi:hypothetical protein